MQRFILLYILFILLISCQKQKPFEVIIDNNNQPILTYHNKVLLENLIVLGENDCLGCIEFSKKGKALKIKENQTSHEYTIELHSTLPEKTEISITGTHTGKVYFGFSSIPNMNRGYFIHDKSAISFQSFGQFNAKQENPVAGTFLFCLPNQYIAIKVKDKEKAGAQYGMYGFVLEKLPAGVEIVVGADSLQVLK